LNLASIAEAAGRLRALVESGAGELDSSALYATVKAS